MSRLPRPNPAHTNPATTTIQAGTPAAAQVIDLAQKDAAIKLQTWTLHQGHCQSCGECGTDPDARPGCDDGYRLWYRWRNAQDRANGLAAALAPEPKPVRPVPVRGHLTLW